MKSRIQFQGLAALLMGLALQSAGAQDGPFPNRPIRFVVGSTAGALLDVASRAYAERMAVFFKQPVIVENVAGASSILAARQVARSNPDGYTLLTAANTIVTTPHLNKAAGYDMARDFLAVGEMMRSPSLLVTGAGTPYKSLADLVAAAKKDQGGVPYASGGSGTTSHLPAELFQRQAGIKFTHVPYKGVAPAVPDVATGRVAFMMSTATSVAELMKSGALRALAITSENRSPAFPNLPTFKEQGYGEVVFDIWVGVFAPAALPKAVRARLAEGMDYARADQALRTRLAGMGQEISSVRTPEQFEAFARQEEEKYRKLIIEAGITGG